MNPADFQDDDGLRAFDEAMKLPVPEGRVDFAAIEARLQQRIEAAGHDALSDLRRLEIPPEGFFDRVEAALFNRIADHQEYGEPVDECIRDIPAYGATLKAEMAIEAALDARLRARGQNEAWEDVLRADHQPAPAVYESIEERLEARIAAEAPAEAWETILRADVAPAAGLLESAEAALDARLAQAAELPDWEQALLADPVPASEHAPAPAWEATEAHLMARIEKSRRAATLTGADAHALPSSSLWLTLGFWLRDHAATGSVAALALAIGVAGWSFLNPGRRPLDTFIYQAQGASATALDTAWAKSGPLTVAGGETVASRENGALTIVNDRGFVELRGGSRLEMAEARKSRVHYRVPVSRDGEARGNAAFFVTRTQGGQDFWVSTQDYRIEVMGTYFEVAPDAAGRASTRVLEGKVRLTSPLFGDTVLHAGQALSYDPLQKAYAITDGGATVARESLEAPPAPSELESWEVLTVSSDPPGAEVRIDGRYRGVTPLAVLQPAGPHSVRIGQGTQTVLDTVLHVVRGANNRLLAFLAPMPAAPDPQPATAPSVTQAQPSRPVPSAAPAPTTATAPAPVEETVNIREAEKLEAKDWRVALKLYERLAADANAPPLRREAARFAMARLRADFGTDPQRARAEFLDYLALHPQGAFAGESWLRLAELEMKERPERAIEYYGKFFSTYPRHHRTSELQHRVGLLQLQLGRTDAAVEMLRRSLANVMGGSGPDREDVAASLARALKAQKADSVQQAREGNAAP